MSLNGEIISCAGSEMRTASLYGQELAVKQMDWGGHWDHFPEWVACRNYFPAGSQTSMSQALDTAVMHARADEVSGLLKALGNAQRLRVLCLLHDQEMSVSQINEQLPDLSQSALSQHLAKLRVEGLVRTRRVSQSIQYTLVDGPAIHIMATLSGILCALD